MARLFAGNLASEVTSNDLRAAFAAYGSVSSADVVLDRSTGLSKGFGFVEMPQRAHATAALRGLDGADLKGRRIVVSPAHPRGPGGNGGNPSRGWDVVGDGRNRW
jgi:RNA recognition motif-containing protein